ncbi:MAG TPA: hypothetical protein VIH45_08490 [Desulfuromonadaceae bacterium]
MIDELVHEIAAEMSVPLSTIQLIDGRRLGFKDSYLLKMTLNNTVASTILHQEKPSEANREEGYDRIRHEIRNALSKLQTLLEK